MLKIKGLTKKFDRLIFNKLDLDFDKRGLYVIQGESGCGKSTLINLISGIDRNYEGDILYNDDSLKEYPDSKLEKFRREEIGIIFQNFNLFENDTVINNLFIVLDLFKINKEDKKIIAYKALKIVGLINKKEEVVKNLSGGEKQRLSIARVLIKNPKIILADEPTGSLDYQNGKRIFKILKKISQKCLVIVVTHDKDFSNRYADKIIKIKDKNAEIIENKTKITHQNLNISLNNNKIKNKELSFRFFFNKFKELLKYKKTISSLMIFINYFLLFLFGITLTLKTSLKDQIISSCESIVGENSLILSIKNDDNSKFEYYSVSKNEALDLYYYSNNIKNVGVSYLNNFNNYFVDQDEIFFINHFNSKIKLNNLLMKNFINYNYLSNFNSIDVYPKNNSKMRSNEIILGINNEDMLLLTNSLRISSTYKALGEYIEKYSPYLLIQVKNYDWGYDDELILYLRGISPQSTTSIYSMDMFFNEILLEDIMRIPSTLYINEEVEFPWTLRKVYYLSGLDNYEIVKELSLNSLFNEYNFDTSIDENKIYVYYSLNKLLGYKDLELIKENFDVLNYYYSLNLGYLNYSSLISGFSLPTFVSNKMSVLDKLVNDKTSFEDYYYLTSNEFINGNYLINNDDKLTYSSNFTKSVNGRYPSSKNEITISKGISDKLNIKIKDKIYLGTFINNEESNLEENFKIVDFKVVGIVEESKNVIYHESYFSLSLYRDILHISINRLNILNLSLFLNEKPSRVKIEEFNKLNSNLLLECPIIDIQENLNSTLDLIFKILLIFTFIGYLCSLILIILLNNVFFYYLKKENVLLKILGFSNIEIARNGFYSNFFLSSVGYLLCIFSLIVFNFITSFVIKKILGGSLIFKFNFSNLVYLFLIILINSVVMFLISYFKIKKINVNKELADI